MHDAARGELNTTNQPPASGAHGPDGRRGRGKGLVVLAIVVVICVGLAGWGVRSRARTLAEVTQETRELAVLTVAVVQPARDTGEQEIVLPGTIQPFADAPIYARTSGYVRKWYADLGAHVKTGQLLADIDTPEVEQELQAAKADLATADANLKLAQTTAQRYDGLAQSRAVSTQDHDNATGNLEARRTAVDSARFNVQRLQQLQGFAKIYAPFDGVITARNLDVGALVEPNNGARELFHISSTRTLRVFVNVPQVYSPLMKTGLNVDLTLPEFQDRRFPGRIARTAGAIDLASRTLLVEIEVQNQKGELLTGSYVQAHFKIAARTATVRVPVNTLLFRGEGTQVATVDAQSRVHLQNVTIQRDLGTELEIASGLTGNEQIIVNPSDSIDNGQTVRVTASAKAKAEKTTKKETK
jgi:RND family efflux transporter MFP subunit